MKIRFTITLGAKTLKAMTATGLTPKRLLKALTEMIQQFLDDIGAALDVEVEP